MTPACRLCGCTDDQACEGGCWWVAEDLCSTCAQALETRRRWDRITADVLIYAAIAAAIVAVHWITHG